MSASEKNFRLEYLIIPVELLCNKNITNTDRSLFANIKLLDGPKGCYASNQYLSTIMGCSISTLKAGLKRLREEKYIFLDSFDGRKRVLKINPDYKNIYKQQVQEYNQSIQSATRRLVEGKETIQSDSHSDNIENNGSDSCVGNRQSQDIAIHQEVGDLAIKGPGCCPSGGQDNGTYIVNNNKSNKYITDKKKSLIFENIKDSCKQPSPQPPFSFFSEETKNIILHWNSLEYVMKVRLNGKRTDVLDRTESWINKAFQGGYNYEDIIRAMDIYNLLLKEIDHIKAPHKLVPIRVSIDNFFSLNKYYRDRINRTIQDHDKKLKLSEFSWFKECYLSDPYEKFKKYKVIEQNPEYTAYLKKRFVSEICNGHEPKWTAKEEDQFKSAANRIWKMAPKLKESVWGIGHRSIVDPSPFVNLIIKALVWKFDNQCGVGNLCSDYTYDRILPEYLKEMGN